MSPPLEAKVVILGSQGVGKTSIARRFIDETFQLNSTSTIGAALMTKKLTMDDTRVWLQIWDTAGQERFRAMAKHYYRGAHAALLVYDITSKESFSDLRSWIDEIRDIKDTLVIAVVGNKIDLRDQEQIPRQKAREFVKEALSPETGFYEVSAKDDDGTIETIFRKITQDLIQRRTLSRDKKKTISQPLREDQPPSSSSCC